MKSGALSVWQHRYFVIPYEKVLNCMHIMDPDTANIVLIIYYMFLIFFFLYQNTSWGTHRNQGSDVQSIISLSSLLVVNLLTVLINTISNSQAFLLKNVSSFCKCKSYSHFFSKNISIYAIFNDQSFNDTLTNNIVSFVQLGPD